MGQWQMQCPPIGVEPPQSYGQLSRSRNWFQYVENISDGWFADKNVTFLVAPRTAGKIMGAFR